MALSQLGCMQKLLDFLRTNTSNVLLEIIGRLSVVLHIELKEEVNLMASFNKPVTENY